MLSSTTFDQILLCACCCIFLLCDILNLNRLIHVFLILLFGESFDLSRGQKTTFCCYNRLYESNIALKHMETKSILQAQMLIAEPSLSMCVAGLPQNLNW